MFGFIGKTTKTLGKVFLGFSAATLISAGNDYRVSRMYQMDEDECTEDTEEAEE